MIDPQHVPDYLKLLRLLGQGGMGSIWIAKHKRLQTRVAVKFLSADIAESPEGVERFKREALSAATIQSPHVVQVLDHGLTANNTPFIVMELLDGEDLAKRIERDGPQSPSDVAAILTQATRALGRAHERGIIHRDIKPENIFMLAGYEDIFLKILDFGIAKRMSFDAALTATGTMVGTPAYASPEQLRSSKHVDHRTDLWSLGVVAYEALTGRLPFDGDNFVQLTLSITRGSFTPPSRLRPGLAPGLDNWFVRALALEPGQRFQSAKELAESFSRVVAGGNLDRASSAAVERAADAARMADAPTVLNAPMGKAPVAPTEPMQPPAATLPLHAAGGTVPMQGGPPVLAGPVTVGSSQSALRVVALVVAGLAIAAGLALLAVAIVRMG